MNHYSWDIAIFGYGNRWRSGRRLFHEFLDPKAVTNFDGYQYKYTYRFLSRLADTPDDFFDHAQLCVSLNWVLVVPSADLSLSSVTGALIMGVTYGVDTKSHEDKFLQSGEHAMKHADKAMVPGAFLVDTFPIRSFSPLVP